MFDPKLTVSLISGALLDREATWRDYLPTAGDWQRTLLNLTMPLVLVSVLGSYLVSLVADSGGLFSQLRPSLGDTIIRLFGGIAAIAVIGLIFATFAGFFGGKNRFAPALAATSLAFVPGYLGQLLVWLPWIGGLLSIGLSIYSLVLLWKIMPLYLEVPEDKRGRHFAASFIVSFLAMLVISRLIMPAGFDQAAAAPVSGAVKEISRKAGTGSPTNEAKLGMRDRIRNAQDDQYTPPTDGRLTEAQVRQYVEAMTMANAKRIEVMKDVEDFQEKAGDGSQVSVAEVQKMMKRAHDVGALATVEIEAVKAAGGNWAEHRWVRQTLFTASRMKDASEATAHNFRLYEQYADLLNAATVQ